jgi:hypothetical protein
MDKALRNAIITGIIIIALSLGYYFVIFLPKKENAKLELQRQQIDQQKQQDDAKLEQQRKLQEDQAEKDELEKQQQATKAIINSSLLNNCLADAQNNYQVNWANNCKTSAKNITEGIKGCRDLDQSKDFCTSLWGTPDSSPNCSLPGKIADAVNSGLENEKNLCLKKYPQ